MEFEQVLSVAALLVSLTLGAFVLLRDWWSKRHGDRRVDVEERALEVDVDDRIAQRRLGEIERLDELVTGLRSELDEMKKSVGELEARDRKKQKTINTQANEIEKTNRLLSDLRTAFTQFVGRVEKAWDDGHPRPSLTAEERALLEDTIPRNRLFKESA